MDSSPTSSSARDGLLFRSFFGVGRAEFGSLPKAERSKQFAPFFKLYQAEINSLTLRAKQVRGSVRRWVVVARVVMNGFVSLLHPNINGALVYSPHSDWARARVSNPHTRTHLPSSPFLTPALFQAEAVVYEVVPFLLSAVDPSDLETSVATLHVRPLPGGIEKALPCWF